MHTVPSQVMQVSKGMVSKPTPKLLPPQERRNMGKTPQEPLAARMGRQIQGSCSQISVSARDTPIRGFLGAAL